MNTKAKQLLEIINEAVNHFAALSENEWTYKSGHSKWSKKEILGHLIDSAANNHQRFVRAQYEDTPVIVYDQNKWNELQNYFYADIKNLIQLFESYNKHIAHILNKMPEDSFDRLCDIKKENPVTIEWIAGDYIRHLKHHLEQIYKT